jgi:hypothetical protein
LWGFDFAWLRGGFLGAVSLRPDPLGAALHVPHDREQVPVFLDRNRGLSQELAAAGGG